MIFSLEHVVNSLAGVLRARYPEYPVYASANQQGTEFPCFFIFFMPSDIEDELNERSVRNLGIDIVFVQERNIVNGNLQLHEIAEYLDERLRCIPYTDGGVDSAWIHTSERQWKIEDEEMHYQFHIKQRVAVPREDILMQEMEENNVGIKEG